MPPIYPPTPARQHSARFHGGPRDGEVHAIKGRPPPVIEVAVPAEPIWCADLSASALPVMATYVARRVVQCGTDHDPALWPAAWPESSYSSQIEYFSTNVTSGSNAAIHVRGSNLYGTQIYSLPSTPLPPLTEAERARQALRAQRATRRRVQANRRARSLLLGLLSEEQQREYAGTQAFTVLARNGKVFRLRKGKTAELLGGDGIPVASYCVHLPFGYAPEDTLAALLLTLRTDPAEFERVANVTQLQRRPQAPADQLAQARQQARWRAEHVAESRAILRSEGLTEAEIDALQSPPNHADGLLVVGLAA